MQQPPNQYPQYPQQQWNPQQTYPPQQGQWNQEPYTPYPPQQPYPQYPPQQGQWQQPPPNMQWQQPYGQPPKQQPKKSGKLKWVLISLGVLLVLCIGACALVSSAFNTAARQIANGTITTPDTSTSTSNTSSSSSNTTSSTNSSSAPVVGKVGQTITVDSVACTLVSVKVLPGDDITQPKAGNEFILVHVKLKNNDSQQTDYNAFDYHAKSGAGNVTDEELVPPK